MPGIAIVCQRALSGRDSVPREIWTRELVLIVIRDLV